MSLSIITVVRNNKPYIEDCINSVLRQTYRDVEYIIIDGGSTDGTIGVIKDAVKRYPERSIKIVSEKDDGIYHAMNKGIGLATGEVVGILNSDDVYFDNNVITTVVEEFETKNVDSVFADMVYGNRDNLKKIVRYYSSAKFNPKKFAYGWMPGHPTFFVRRRFYEKYGLFKTDYKIASDYELLVRFLAKYKISYSYIPKILVTMRMGGISTKNLKSNWIMSNEIVRACRNNGIKTNILKVLLKYPTKIFQLINRPRLR
jgi:glycosyltransferase involved in cell wall biosynthesis